MADKKTTPRRVSSGRTKASISLWELKKEIDERAHQIYLDRISTHTPGDELSDWLRAEAEIKKKHKLG